MFVLLFLLLPVAAAYGWYMGRRSLYQKKLQKDNRLSSEYLTGIDFLLLNKKDKAVDLLLSMLKENNGTVETYLTLGNLFRSQGEVYHAIRIHQSIMNIASIKYEHRLFAIQQLGRDYMVAGLYDRAENMFNQLINETNYRVSALQQLLLINQSISDWKKAIDIAKQLVQLGKEKHKSEIAHFYCELALVELNSNDLDHAILLLKQGAFVDSQNARVSIMMGSILMKKEEYAEAAEYLQYVLEQDKDLVNEILSILEICYKQLKQPESWTKFLQRCVNANTGAMAELYLSDILEQQQGVKVAQIYINHQLQLHPTMRVFHRLMDFYLHETENEPVKESIMVLRDTLGEQIRTKPGYYCEKCGFTAYKLYWNCPSCRSWSSVKLIRGLDGQ